MSFDPTELLISVGVIVLASLLLLVMRRRALSNEKPALRPLPALDSLVESIGRSAESATRSHISLGRAGLSSVSNPTSLAAISLLDRLARDGCASDTPPIVTTGEGTLLLVAQQRMRRAFRLAGRGRDYEPIQVQFLANDSDAFSYAGGVSSIIHRHGVSSNTLVGRFGPEISIMAEAAARQDIPQVIGSDDPVALALATAVTDNVLIGEELLAAGAYLEGSAPHLATLQVQDFLRLLIAITILGLSVYYFVVG